MLSEKGSWKNIQMKLKAMLEKLHIRKKYEIYRHCGHISKVHDFLKKSSEIIYFNLISNFTAKIQ